MEWRPKQRKADDETSAGTNMVFILPSEFSAPGLDEAPVAQLDCGPRLHDALKVDDSKRINMIKSEVGLVLSTSLTE
jgi:hypothetical protein